MKLLSLIAFLAFFGQAFAVQTVELNSKHIVINSDEAILVRTAATPDKVKLTMSIPVTKTQCIDWDTKEVFGQNATYCGTHIEYRQVWRQYTYCSAYQNGHCVSWSTGYRWETVPVTIANSCVYPVRVCVQYGPVTYNYEDRVSIVFKKNLPKLSADDREEFRIKGNNAPTGFDSFSYTLEAVKTAFDYEIDGSSFLDRFVIRNK